MKKQFLCFMFLMAFLKVFSQTKSIEVKGNKTAYQGNAIGITFSGSNVSFSQGSSTVCQGSSTIKINTSNVALKKGTTEIYPYYTQGSGTLFNAYFRIPSDAPLGSYDAMVSPGSSCQLTDENAINVLKYDPRNLYAYVDYYSNDAYTGDEVSVNFYSENVSFSQGSSTICQGSSTIDISVNNIVLRNNESIIYPMALQASSTNGTIDFIVPSGIAEGPYQLVFAEGLDCELSTENTVIWVHGERTPSVEVATIGIPFRGEEKLEVILVASDITFKQGSSTICTDRETIVLNEDNVMFKQNNNELRPDSLLVYKTSAVAYFNVGKCANTGFYDLVLSKNSECELQMENSFYLHANSKESQLWVCETGIDDLGIDKSISVFPDPANDYTNVQIVNHNNDLIRIVDATGNQIFESRVTNKITTIDLSDFDKGLYFILIENELGNSSRKLIKN